MNKLEIVRFGPMRLAGLRAEDGVNGARDAFSLLRTMRESIYPGGYGEIDPKTGEIVYPGEYGYLAPNGEYHAALILDFRNNKSSQLVQLEIPRGDYMLFVLQNWQKRPEVINETFASLAEQSAQVGRQEDENAPRVEVYRTAGAVALLLPLLNREKE